MEGDDQDGYKWTVSDVDAQKRWTFDLQGIPGRLTIVEVLQVEYADNGVDVVDTHKLFTMGTRDGSKPSIHEDLIFEPGEYILGVAHGGGGGAYRPPVDSVSFEDSGRCWVGGRIRARRVPSHDPRRQQALSGTNRRSARLRDSAYKLRLGSENAAYLETPDTWYSFDISDKDAGQSWDLNGQVPVGRQVNATLHPGDGSQLAKTSSDGKGRFSFRDLGLEVGSYAVELSSQDSGYIRALVATSVGQRIEGAEAEPNDAWALANRADLSQPVTGRMGKSGESDYFLFTLDDATADQVLTLELETGADQKFTLCLLNHKGATVQCRTNTGTVALVDLVLTPGEWGFTARRGPENAEYSVTLSQQGPIEAGVEAEPNDTIETAAAVPSNNRIKGRFSGSDTDFFQVLVTEEPQLWRVQVIGDEIHELAYNDGAGIQSQVYRAPAGQRRVRLDNLFLMPGLHHFRVTGRDGGTYTLLARAIGPPDPNGEFEPNDDTSRMQPLRFGQTRTGLLEDKQDSDNYRFYLGAWDHIRLTLSPPPDGEILANLYWDKSRFKQFNAPQTGQEVVLEGLFPPGDYYLALNAKKTSEAEYKLSLERLDRFGCPTDCEPNDNLDFASPLPADHVLEGRASEWRDSDWYRLPVFDQPTEITLACEPRQALQVLTREYAARSLVAWDNEAGQWQGTLPAGVQTYVKIGVGGPYRFVVDFPNGPQAQARTRDVSTRDGDDPGGQGSRRLPPLRPAGVGHARLSNQGSANAESPSRPRPATTAGRRLSPTGSTRSGRQFGSVPMTVMCLPMPGPTGQCGSASKPPPWTARAVESFLEIQAGRETNPVNAVYGWTLARGAARWLQRRLGRSRWPLDRRDRYLDRQRLSLSVRRHGGRESRTPAARRNPATRGRRDRRARRRRADRGGRDRSQRAFGGGRPAFPAQPRLRAVDGRSAVHPALEGELLPIKAEQYFVLDTTRAARFARLRPKHAFDGTAGPGLGFGELKVIAKPGSTSQGQGIQPGRPGTGWACGLVTSSNHPSGWDSTLLSDPESYTNVRLKPGQTQDFVIGFHHDRAAQIRRIEWIDRRQSGRPARFGRVALSVSLDSPLGPWRPIGDWNSHRLPCGLRPRCTGLGAFCQILVYEERRIGMGVDSLDCARSGSGRQTMSIARSWPSGASASQAAIYEALHPLRSTDPSRRRVTTRRPRPQPSSSASFAGGQVVLGKHEHWYKLECRPARTR